MAIGVSVLVSLSAAETENIGGWCNLRRIDGSDGLASYGVDELIVDEQARGQGELDSIWSL